MEIERLRARLLHQPRNERLNLLRRHRPGAEDERIGFLPFVLLRVDVERLRLLHDGPLDRLPRRTVDAAQDDVHAIVAHEFLGLRARDAVVGLAVFENQLQRSAKQPARRVDVLHDHPGRVRAGDAQRSQRPRLVHDDADFDRAALHSVLLAGHDVLSSETEVVDVSCVELLLNQLG